MCLRKQLGAEGSCPLALVLTRMSRWPRASHLNSRDVWSQAVFLHPVACLISLHQCACAPLRTPTKTPGQLEKCKRSGTRIVMNLLYFPLSPEKNGMCHRKNQKSAMEISEFVSCWSKELPWLSQHVLPLATPCWPHASATTDQRYPTSENGFCHYTLLRFRFLVPRCEYLPLAPHSSPAKPIIIHREGWREQ